METESNGGQMLLLRAKGKVCVCGGGFAHGPRSDEMPKFTLHQSAAVLEVGWMSRPKPYGVG